MREVNETDLGDIARGSAVLASGGGGDPYLGTIASVAALEEFGPASVVTVDELPDDGLVVCSALFGAPLPYVEKLTGDAELLAAFEVLRSYLGKDPIGIIPIEAGGANMMAPFILASRLGLPVVDGDYMGRAFPELALLTLTIHDVNVGPTAIADEHGNSVIVNAVDNYWADRLCRAAAIQFGATAAECTAAISAAVVRDTAVLGSISRAQRIGRSIREASEAKEHPLPRLLAATEGFELFRGKIVDVERRTEQSSTFGHVVVEGTDAHAGARLQVRFRNENLVAETIGGEVLATVPDIITVVDADTAQVITTERLRYGFRVAVIGVPVDTKWRTTRGVELGGPRHFGYDLDYVPVEHLVAQRATTSRE